MKTNNAKRLVAVLMALLLSITMVLPAFAASVVITEEEYKEYAQAAAQQVYEYLMSLDKYTVVEVVLENVLDEQFETILSHLGEEEREAYAAYVQQLFIKAYTANVTHAGPFKPAVDVSHLMSSAERSAFGLLNTRTVAGDTSTADNGLRLTKTAVANEDGSQYTVTLEAYTTGNVTTETTTVPVDIVLVLDQSSSMQSTKFGTDGDSYQKGLADAFEAFIADVVDKYDDVTADHRIAVVTFNSEGIVQQDWTLASSVNAFSDVQTALDNGINGTNPHYISSNTRPELGMNKAVDLFDEESGTGSYGYDYTGNNTTRQKVVIMFSDGVPSTSGSTAYTSSYADDAIDYAKTLKDAGCTVYSIGIFKDADPNELYGTNSSSGTAGTVGYTWTEDYAAAGNRYLNYLSSNSPNATSDGLDVTTSSSSNNGRPNAGGNSGTRTYEITANYTWSNSGYYLDASSTEGLVNVFKSISSQISTPTISLGSSTVVQDVISPYFTLPANADASSIKTYTADSTDGSGNNWKDRVDATGVTATIVSTDTSGKTLEVTGFNFNDNFVSEDPRDNGFYGRKLIMEFVVVPESDFLGGNQVVTNGSAGVYSNGSLVEPYGNPTVDVPVKAITPSVQDQSIYLTNAADLTSLVVDETKYVLNGTTYTVDGENNKYVEIKYTITDEEGNAVATFTIPAGETAATVQWEVITAPVLDEDTEYTVTCTVTPSESGTYSVISAEATSTVYVYKPVLTFEDGIIDYNTALYDDATFNSTTADTKGGYVSVVWKHGDTIAPDAMGAAPDLTKTYEALDGVTDGIVTALEEVPMKVTVKIGSTDVTTYTTIYRDACNIVGEVSGEECDWSALATAENTVEKPAFVLHVINTVGDLKISKEVVYDTDNSKIPNANDTFTFEVTLGDDATATYSYQIFNVGEETDTAAGDAQTMTGTTVEITLKDGQYVLFSDVMCDTAYTVEELALPTDYTLESTSNNLTGSIEPAETIEVEFVNRYHKLGSLTISKTGLNQYTYTDGSDNESAIFTVTGPNGESWTVVLTGNKSVTIDNLLAGTYTVHEESGWTWRYKALADQTAIIEQGSDEAVEFENVHENQSWLGGDNYTTNVFNAN